MMRCLPMYMQIAEAIKKKLGTGKLLPGERLPGEFQLAEDFNVSRRTVRKALEVLYNDGFVIRKKGVGSTIAPANMHNRRVHSDIAIISPANEINPRGNYNSVFAPDAINQGVVQALAERGHWLRYIPWSQKDCYYDIDAVLNTGIDGFVFPVPSAVRDVLERVVAERRPHIACEAPLNIAGLNVIAVDEFESGRQAVKKLCEHNYKNIAFLGGVMKEPSRNTANWRRYQGFLAGCAENNICPSPDNILIYSPELGGVEGARDCEFVPGAVQKLLGNNVKRPDAIVASSLDVAACILDAANVLNLAIPRDLGIITFSGAVNMRDLSRREEVMRLAMFATDENVMGARAVEILQEWLLDPTFRSKFHPYPTFFQPGNSLI